jgi:hypothetical protein
MGDTAFPEYSQLFRTAFYATIAMLIIIPLQILVFALTRLPETTVGWFALFRDELPIALFHADLFILVNNILISIIYLAFYHSLKGINKGVMQIGIMLGLIGIAAYISSNKTFELLRLSNEYFKAEDDAARIVIESAGKASLAGWQGTAFDTYYVLNGIALFCVSILMFKSPLYSKATAVLGLLAAFFMIIPSTAGMLGLVFSLLSLIPWYAFSVKFALVFRKLSR